MFKSQREVIKALANGETLVTEDNSMPYNYFIMGSDGFIKLNGDMISFWDLPHFSTLKVLEETPFKSVTEMMRALLGGEKIRCYGWPKGEFVRLIGNVLIDETDETRRIDDVIIFDSFKEWHIFS